MPRNECSEYIVTHSRFLSSIIRIKFCPSPAGERVGERGWFVRVRGPVFLRHAHIGAQLNLPARVHDAAWSVEGRIRCQPKKKGREENLRRPFEVLAEGTFPRKGPRNLSGSSPEGPLPLNVFSNGSLVTNGGDGSCSQDALGLRVFLLSNPLECYRVSPKFVYSSSAFANGGSIFTVGRLDLILNLEINDPSQQSTTVTRLRLREPGR